MSRFCSELTIQNIREIIIKVLLTIGFILFLLSSSHAAEKEKSNAEAVFRMVDLINDGRIDRGEFDIYHVRVFNGLDMNDDGFITYQECTHGCFKHLNDDGIYAIGASSYKFQTIDADESGDVSISEYILYGRDQFDFYDVDRNGSINVDEFCTFYRESSPCIFSSYKRRTVNSK